MFCLILLLILQRILKTKNLFHKILMSTTVLNIDNNKKCFMSIISERCDM